MLATLQKPGKVPSFSRPGVSMYNSYPETLFRTIKYRPVYPFKPFFSLPQAHEWVDEFVVWYNTKNLRGRILFVTPDGRHYGRHLDILKKRHEVYQKARTVRTERRTSDTRNWQPELTVIRTPGKKQNHIMKKSYLEAA
ncbi:integrase core domain-containing protein [Desulfobotulus sp. H1]|uniref:Integrase core domain-containing protein n=1 Tax=Desulfobotulus pelophilus TaxID=2823377 RepID=A0ABT3NA80_9BACT|nr:integrase core domain-containing protein [Desulfobotulus pelophilus]MCW7754374.1 integrase core domain-containing protein [Desulfobotulus pelophilus]